MIQAFKPKKSLFIHRCANCEFAVKKDIRGTAMNYICTQEEDGRPLAGAHICDVDITKSGEQLNWFKELKEDQ